MPVDAYYRLRTQPNYDFLADAMIGWIAQRGAENKQARVQPDEDLGKLEIELAKNLGKLQEAKGRGLSLKDVQELKHDAEYAKIMGALEGRRISAGAQIASAQIGLAGKMDENDAARVRRNESEMDYRQPGTPATIAEGIDRAVKSGDATNANLAAQTAINAAMNNEGISPADTRHPKNNRIAYEAWQKARSSGGSMGQEVANAIAGKYFGGRNPEEVMDMLGPKSTTELRDQWRSYLRGGTGRSSFEEWLDEKARSEAPTGSVTGHSESSRESGGGGGMSSDRLRMKGGAADIEVLASAADAGDPVAKTQLQDIFDDAIAEQRALLDDVRARRSEVRNPLGVPTGNLLIDNPNTYVKPYHDPISRALRGPRPKRDLDVLTMVDEERAPKPSLRNVREYTESAPTDLNPGLDEAGAKAETTRRKRLALAQLAPAKKADIDKLSDEEVEVVYAHPKTQAALGGE